MSGFDFFDRVRVESKFFLSPNPSPGTAVDITTAGNSKLFAICLMDCIRGNFGVSGGKISDDPPGLPSSHLTKSCVQRVGPLRLRTQLLHGVQSMAQDKKAGSGLV